MSVDPNSRDEAEDKEWGSDGGVQDSKLCRVALEDENGCERDCKLAELSSEGRDRLGGPELQKIGALPQRNFLRDDRRSLRGTAQVFIFTVKQLFG